ncbi:hypothetical protein ANN_21223 [Periplaneta americana]|uniref:DUF4371 domain-containing protein n=1 Tax=Periplaneta americana TaxID=6978 RepID=A0ABQ8SFW0_PERAM|nr:hypothetical protein ANN_21223 [Periplaneta americana]
MSEKQLKLFGKTPRIEFSLNNQYKFSIDQHNIEVKKNRAILSHFIRAVCFLSNKGLAFRGHDESAGSSNRGNYIEYIDEVSTYDMSLKEHLEKSTVFRGTLPDIQNDLISSMSAIMTREIKKEISEASFVSLLLDETPDVSNKEQLSTVFRYVTVDGNIEERFICFTDVWDAGLINGLLLLINVLCLQGIPLKSDCRIKNDSLRLSPVDGYNICSSVRI